MEWWKEKAVYQIYPRSFKDSDNDGIGDINGIIEKLDYIKGLGVGAIWLCPVFDSPQADNGYDIKDYKNIYKEYGSLEDICRLIEEAHKRELKVLMDLVANHTSSEHPWFLASRDKDSPYRDYYYWRKGIGENPPSNWAGEFCESAWTFDEQSGEYYFHTFSPSQPDLNWNNSKVVDEVCGIMQFWHEKGVDGWRIDAIPYIDKDPDFKDYDPSGFPPEQKFYMGDLHYKNGRLYDFIKILNKRVWSKQKDCITVAELPGAYRQNDILKFTAGQTAFTMCFTFDHLGYDAKHGTQFRKWTKAPLDLVGLKKNLANSQKLNQLGGNVALFFNNHDQPRWVSRFTDPGEFRNEYAKMLAIMLHLMGGTSFIYQGEEIGMTNCPFSKNEYKDLEFFGAFDEYVKSGRMSEEDFLEVAAYRARDNARTPMQWDNSKYAGFSSAEPWIKVNPNYTEINVAAQTNDENSVLSCYKNLLNLKQGYDVVKTGVFKLLKPNDKSCFTYERHIKKQTLFVSCNFTNKIQTRTLPFKLIGEAGQVVASSYGLSEVPHFRYKLRPFEGIAVLYKPR